MAQDEKTARREVTRKRAKAKAERAKRAEAATAAWRASGKAPALKGKGARRPGETEKDREPLPPDVLAPEQVRAMLEACGTSTTGIRNAAMLATLYGSAIRISEACGLYPADLNLAAGEGLLDGGALYLRARKGGHHDTIAISRAMVPYLVAWTERRASLGLNGRDPYFCAIAGDSLGNPTSASYWRHLLPKLAEKAGIEGLRVHPHGLRRTAATHMRDAGVPLDVIQRQLGHKNLATTQVYLGARADADHRRIVGDWGAEPEQVEQAQPIPSGAFVSLAEAQAEAAASFARLPADVREAMSAEQVQGFMAGSVAGSVSAWRSKGAPQ